QIVNNRMQRPADQVGPVIQHIDDYVLRQRLLNHSHLFFHPLHDCAAVFAIEHHHDGGDDLAAGVAGRGPLADERSDDDLSHVAHENRQIAGATAHHNVFNVARTVKHGLAANETLLVLVDDVGT